METCSPPESPPESEEDQREALGEHRSGESQASLPVLMQLERAEAWSFEDGQASVGPEPPLMGSWGRVSVLEEVAKELSLDHSVVIGHLKQIGKVKKAH